MIVCLPITPDGRIEPRWGRAPRVAVADVRKGAVVGWDEFAVGWDVLHDLGPEGGHHARVAGFLRQHGVETVLADHMGEPMVRMLERMGIVVRLGVGGDARRAAIEAARPMA